MKNPWEEIRLTDYENHMKLDTVMQLQAMNEMMKMQFDRNSAKTSVSRSNGAFINIKLL